ncbi:MAG: hypothetical protein LBT37_08075 [Lactobacillaceae bacterium]|jgi:hypothetical protein|nr:hypothetical protein [Lactobacillaceae bacterium]
MKTRSPKYDKNSIMELARQIKFAYPLWNTTIWGQRLELKKVADPTVLDNEETILDMAPIRYNGDKALLVITDAAVHVLNYGLFGKVGANNETVYWSRIIGSNPTHHLIRGELELHTGSANEDDYHFTRIWHGDLDRITQTIHHQLQVVNQKSTQSENSAGPSLSLADQLAEINQALQAGTISEEDAARAKDKLLG